MSKVRVTVSIPNATPKRLKAEKANLTAQGMEVDSILAGIGVITGSVTGARLGKLSAGEDASIEVEQQFEIAPPDSGTQ